MTTSRKPERIKIALVDNMNNNFFAITRYFRDLGVDAHLYLIPGSIQTHFHPQSDTFQDLQNVDWIKEFPLDYFGKSILRPKKKLLRRFRNYDYVIACGLSVGYLNAAGIKVDMFIPYGSDLFSLPFYRFPYFGNPVKYLLHFLSHCRQAIMQANGIKRSRIIISNRNWTIMENSVKSLGIQPINLPRLMIYPQQINDPPDDRWEFMDCHDFKVFSPTRHLWKTNADWMPDFPANGGMKRNDKLIRAFARIVNQNCFHNPCLILFEYGQDIDYSKALIKTLGIAKHVVWIPLVPRKIIMQGMAKSSIVADQFRKNMSGTSAGVTNEAMAVGVPVITNTDGAIFDPVDPYYNAPILDAIEEDEIFAIFLDYASNPEKYVALGKNAQNWFHEHLGIGLAKKYLSLLAASPGEV